LSLRLKKKRNMLNLIKKKYQYLFIFFIWIIFASPYLFFGKAPYPSTYQVNHFAPWSSYPEYWGPVKNGAMPDIIDQIYPWKYLTINSLKEGQIPFWNPYNFSGNPHLANFQSAVLSPFNSLFFVFPFIDAWSIVVLLAPLLAGVFTYLFVRLLKVSQLGALVSAISFMFCGFITVWMAYGTLSLAIAFLPLALFGIEKWFGSRKFWALIILAFSIPLSLFSGHFQTSLYFLLFVFAYMLFKLFTSESKKLVVPIFMSFIFGILISFPQLLPSAEFYENSVRSQSFNTGGGISWWHLVTIFSPDFFGNPVTRNDWMGNYAEWANFIGIIPFALLFFSFFSFKKNLAVTFFIITGATFTLLAIDTPLQAVIGKLQIPVLSTSNPTRIIVLESFAFAILAGFGFEHVMDFIKKNKRKKLLIGFIPTLIIIFSIWICILFFKLPSVDTFLIAKRNMILPTILFAIFFFAAFFGIYIRSKKIILQCVIFAILLLVSYDSLRFAQKWMPFDPRNLVFPDNPVITGIKNNIEFGRIFGNLGTQVESYYGFPSIEGYDPLYIGKYGQFIRYGVSNEFLEGERSVVRLAKFQPDVKRVLDTLGVGLIFHPLGDTNQSWAFPVWRTDGYQEIYRDEKFALYKNTTAFPRVMIFNQAEVIKNSKDILRKFYSDNFDYRSTLLLEEGSGVSLDKNSKGRAEIISYTPNKIFVRTTVDNDSLLFLADNYYPGWKAYIDGVETKILRANYSFRAVVVPEGEHEVVFVYFPESFRLGIVGAIIGLIGLVALYLKIKK
jgi:hypothetical protein